MFDLHSSGLFGATYRVWDLLTCSNSTQAHISWVILCLLIRAATEEHGKATETKIMKSNSAAQKIHSLRLHLHAQMVS